MTTDPSKTAAHRSMIYPTQKIAELIAENSRLRKALSDIATMAEWHPDGATAVYAQNRAHEAIND